VAIKTVVFESTKHDSQTALVASEAAIASNMVHNNIVATYWHGVRTVSDAQGLELGIFKLCLVQVRLPRCTWSTMHVQPAAHNDEPLLV
jgi:hypothetical protein